MKKNYEVTFEQVKSWDKNEYQLVDIRDERTFMLGAIPGAVNVPYSEDGVNPEEFSNDKKTVLYCNKGVASAEAVNQLRASGIEAYSLKGGFDKWLVDNVKVKADTEEKEIITNK